MPVDSHLCMTGVDARSVSLLFFLCMANSAGGVMKQFDINKGDSQESCIKVSLMLDYSSCESSFCLNLTKTYAPIHSPSFPFILTTTNAFCTLTITHSFTYLSAPYYSQHHSSATGHAYTGLRHQWKSKV